MPEPVTIAMISAGIAALGTTYSIGSSVSGDDGFNVSDCSIRYPKEFPPEQLMDVSQSVQWDIIKFTGDNWVMDHELTVSATGYLGNDNGDLYGYSDSAHPNVPINRFVALNLTKSGTSENLSSGFLNCNIEPWGGAEVPAEGTAEDPWVALHVHGRWDPAGIGDMQFSFKMSINTQGVVEVSNVTYNGTTTPADDFVVDDRTRDIWAKMEACQFTCEPATDHVIVDMR